MFWNNTHARGMGVKGAGHIQTTNVYKKANDWRKNSCRISTRIQSQKDGKQEESQQRERLTHTHTEKKERKRKKEKRDERFEKREEAILVSVYIWMTPDGRRSWVIGYAAATILALH